MSERNSLVVARDTMELVGAKRTLVADTGGRAPDNSELRKIADDVANAVCYSMVAVAADPGQQVRGGSFEEAFQGYLGTLAAPRRDLYLTAARALAGAPAAAREVMFGRFGRLAPNELAAMGFDRAAEGLDPVPLDRKLLGFVEPKVPLSALRATADGLLLPAGAMPGGDLLTAGASPRLAGADRLRAIWGTYYEDAADAPAGDEFEGQSDLHNVALQVVRVRCEDETNPEWAGDDEISIAGVSIDEDGDVKKVGEKYVGGGFEDGDEKNYGDKYRFHWFNATEGKYWPKVYQVSLILAEKDDGGLASFLSTLYDKVKGQVHDAVVKAMEAAAAALDLGPAVGKALGEAVAYVVDKVVNFLVSLFKDDIFPVHVARLTHAGYGARFTVGGVWGSTSSAVQTAHFYGHGGHYSVRYYWKLF